MTYQVKLEVFEGPFDLLLQLIARRRLDVSDVALAEITGDFLDELSSRLEELDLETATRFLVVAATLVELKGARLLPQDQREELDDMLGEARDLLYARLLEYRAFRDVARVIAHRVDRFAGYVPREVPPEPWMMRLVPDTQLPIDAHGLAALAAATTAPRPMPEVDLTHIRRSYLTIRDAARQVLGALPDPGTPIGFRRLTDGRDRGDRVVLFLALLELFKLGHVDLEQADHRGELCVERLDGGDDLDAITEEDLIADGASGEDDAVKTLELAADR